MSPRPALRSWALPLLAAAAFFFGFAAGQAHQLGSKVLYWSALILGGAVWASPLWEAYTAHQMLQLERRWDRNATTAADLLASQRLTDLDSLANQVYERALRYLRRMPDAPVDTCCRIRHPPA